MKQVMSIWYSDKGIAWPSLCMSWDHPRIVCISWNSWEYLETYYLRMMSCNIPGYVGHTYRTLDNPWGSWTCMLIWWLYKLVFLLKGYQKDDVNFLYYRFYNLSWEVHELKRQVQTCVSTYTNKHTHNDIHSNININMISLLWIMM